MGDLGSIPDLASQTRIFSPGGGHSNPQQYSCLENPHGQRSLAGYNPRGLKESDTAERLSTSLLFFSPSVVSKSLQPRGCQVSLSFNIYWISLKLMSIESGMPSKHLIPCHLLLLLPSVFPASGSFPMSQLFALGGQTIAASASASVLPKNIQDLFPLGLTALISLH